MCKWLCIILAPARLKSVSRVCKCIPTFLLATARSFWLFCILAVAMSWLSAAHANVWVLEPSASVDQRFDDNYTIDTELPEGVTATRLVGNLGLSRESKTAVFKGLIRIDGLLTQTENSSDELSSNQILFLDSNFTRARSTFGIGLNFKQDTPSRDISADLTDISSIAADTGASVTQDENVARRRFVINPNMKYELTRRSTFEAGLSFTAVEHDLPGVQDALRKQWLLRPGNTGLTPPAELTIDDVGGVFTVNDELDDFVESEIELGFRYRLSPISTLSLFAGYSDYIAQTEPDADVVTPFDEKIEDADERQILRNPKRDTLSTTLTFRLGYERILSPTLDIAVVGGIYTNETDTSALFQQADADFLLAQGFMDQQTVDSKFANQVSSSQGWLANVTLTKDTGLTQYVGKFGVDVLPSDVGAQVESLELTGDLFRQISPLLDFSLRARAYEPDTLNASNTNKFQRRFISVEPKLIWRFSRAWTAAASYRYRRQKSRVDTQSGESNALLFSLKYTPPSAIRDAQKNR